MPTSKDDVVEELAMAMCDYPPGCCCKRDNRPPSKSNGWGCKRDVERARAVFTKLESLGLVVVPREPTLEACHAGYAAAEEYNYGDTVLGEDVARATYRAMIDSVSRGD